MTHFWSGLRRPVAIPPVAHVWVNLRIMPLILLLIGTNQVWSLARSPFELAFGWAGALVMAISYVVGFASIHRIVEATEAYRGRFALIAGVLPLAFAFLAFWHLGRFATNEFQWFLGTEMILGVVLLWRAFVTSVFPRPRVLPVS